MGRAVRHADGCADFHHRLVERARVPFRHDGGGLFPQICLDTGVGDGAEILGQACHDAQHVAVHRRDAFAESNGSNRPGGIVADAGQAQQFRVGAGEYPAVFRADYLCRAVQVAYPAVIAQPFPELEAGLLLRVRKRPHIGQRLHEPRVIPAHRFHPCLLQHDFAHPNAVGVAGVPPGKVALLGFVPGQKGRDNRGGNHDRLSSGRST